MDRSNGPRQQRRLTLLAIILLVGLGLRLGWAIGRPADRAAMEALPDQRGYLEVAENLLAGRGLKFFDERFGQDVYAVRTPGYPLFLAVCGASVQTARVAQCLLDTSTALAVLLLAGRLLPRGRAGAATAPATAANQRIGLLPQGRAGGGPLVAAALVAFNPFLIYFCALLLTETLFTAMLAWGMFLLTGGRRATAAGLLVLALSVSVRPSAIALPVLLGVAGAWAARGRTRRSDEPPAGKKALVPIVVSALAAALLTVAVLLPWAWRNHRVLGRWIWGTSNDGITLYDGFNPAATGASDQSFVQPMLPDLRRMNELERSDFFAAEAKRFIRNNPGRAAELTVAKVLRTWSPVPLSAEFATPRHVAVGLLFSVPFMALALLGLFRGGLKRSTCVFLVLPALYFTAVHALSVGSLRYRIPAEPPLAVIAAAGALALARAGAAGKPPAAAEATLPEGGIE